MNIFLCGFMGCGKSTIGKIFAEKSGMTFIDMDTYIEEKAGLKIPEIFAKYGEEGFRKIEHEACAELAAKKDSVIACGGGAALFAENAEAMKQGGILVFLDVPPENLIRRLRLSSAPRPVIEGKSDGEILEIYEKRLPLYLRHCTAIIPCGENAERNAEKILGYLKLN